MPLHPGAPFGLYEVLAPLGAGGMGEVYRARDLKLRRDVALKVLPDAVARDPDRRRALRARSQVLAALNHPHIAAIYGIVEDGASRALVMELVEGPTLADRPRSGPASARRALPIARQIAEALEAAHEPASSIAISSPPTSRCGRRHGEGARFRAREGARRARPAHRQRPHGLADAHRRRRPLTGMILGTAAYMAPEQARGRPSTSARTSGRSACVLYEMLTGRPLFDGDDANRHARRRARPATIDWTRVAGVDAAAHRRPARRCLERDPKKRLRDIGDVRLDDRTLATASAISSAPSTPGAGGSGDWRWRPHSPQESRSAKRYWRRGRAPGAGSAVHLPGG